MTAIYVGAVYGMSDTEVLMVGIAINVAAGASAVGFGFVNDRIGGKRTIAISLVVLIASVLFASWAPDVPTFWVAVIGVGIMVGPNQAASRREGRSVARCSRPCRWKTTCCWGP